MRMILLAALLLPLAACGSDAEASAPPPEDTRLADAHRECSKRDTIRTLTVADKGATLLIDTNPNDVESSQYSQPGDTGPLWCVLDALQAPQSVVSRVERTTSLQGVQEAEHAGLHLSWTFHPDSGNEMIITRV